MMLFGAKSRIRLSTGYTESEINNIIYHHLKELSDHELKGRKSAKENKLYGIISEIEHQLALLEKILLLAKIKLLRAAELNKNTGNIINGRIGAIIKEAKSYKKDFGLRQKVLSREEDLGQHLKAMHKHIEKRYEEHIRHYKEMLKETERIRKEIKKGCKTGMLDYKIIIKSI